MILEDISGKFGLVLEGQESLRRGKHVIRDELSEKIETNSFKIDVLNQKIDGVEENLTKKIDAVAADLQAHLADTELHRGVQVRED